MSGSCKKAGYQFKLDLRLIVLPNDEVALEGCTGEIARRATVKKVFRDKLKSTIASKCHLNTILKEMTFIRGGDVKLVKIPILQIAGFDAKLSVLSLVKKKEYMLEEISSFSFPKSLYQLQNGTLEHMVNVLATVNGFTKLFEDYTVIIAQVVTIIWRLS